MHTYAVPYGHATLAFQLPAGQSADVILPPVAVALPTAAVQEKLCAALLSPIGAPPLAQHCAARSVAIAINDKTRPVPYDLLLPPLLAHLEGLGIPPQAICLFIANGTHIPMPPAEYPRILQAEIIARYPILSHSCDADENLVRLGNTARGTEIWVNQKFYESELKIVTGNIEPHHFAGFSGGAKTASIGVCSRNTINQNHAMLVDPNSMIGIYEINPLRQDIEDIGDQIGIDYALNFVMSGEREIAEVLFGSPRAVMQAGIPIAISTDGSGSADNQNILSAARLASQYQKALHKRAECLPAQQVLEMITVEAARILRIDAGSLAPGKAADLVLVDLRRPNLVPTRRTNVVENLIWASDGSEVRFVVAAGRVVKDDYRLTTIDLEDVCRKITWLSVELDRFKSETGELRGTGAHG